MYKVQKDNDNLTDTWTQRRRERWRQTWMQDNEAEGITLYQFDTGGGLYVSAKCKACKNQFSRVKIIYYLCYKQLKK